MMANLKKKKVNNHNHPQECTAHSKLLHGSPQKGVEGLKTWDYTRTVI